MAKKLDKTNLIEKLDDEDEVDAFDEDDELEDDDFEDDEYEETNCDRMMDLVQNVSYRPKLAAWVTYGKDLVIPLEADDIFPTLFRIDRGTRVRLRPVPVGLPQAVSAALLASNDPDLRMRALNGTISLDAAKKLLRTEEDEDMFLTVLRDASRLAALAADAEGAEILTGLLQNEDRADAVTELLLAVRKRADLDDAGRAALEPFFTQAEARDARLTAQIEAEDRVMRLVVGDERCDPFDLIAKAEGLPFDRRWAWSDAELPSGVMPIPSTVGAGILCEHFFKDGELGPSDFAQALLRGQGKDRFMRAYPSTKTLRKAFMERLSTDPRVVVRAACASKIRRGRLEKYEEDYAAKLFNDPSSRVRTEVLKRGFHPTPVPVWWFERLLKEGSSEEKIAAVDVVLGDVRFANRVGEFLKAPNLHAAKTYADRVAGVIDVAKEMHEAAGVIEPEDLFENTDEELLLSWLDLEEQDELQDEAFWDAFDDEAEEDWDDEDEDDDSDEDPECSAAAAKMTAYRRDALTALNLMREGVTWLDYERWQEE